MRSGLAVLGCLLALSGCSSSYSPSIPGALTLSSKVAPFPADYVSLVQKRLGSQRQPDFLISRPQTMIGAGVFDAQRWYVCLRRAAGPAETIFVISGGEIEGEIDGPAPALCNNGVYQPLG